MKKVEINLSIFLLILIFFANKAFPQTVQNPTESKPQLSIPKVTQPPALEDFIDMKPGGEFNGKLAKAENFIQQRPKDGEPATQKTEVYICYDDKNLYVIWVAFDTEPKKIRARMAKRENALDDDWVELTLDTYQDQRRGYVFQCNPLGVQADAIWNEDAQGPDFTFDTLWRSHGKLTKTGYIVLMEIPFKSLRFSPNDLQNWGIVLLRRIPHASDEWGYWPRVSSRIQGRLTQAATMTDMKGISPGRNIQLIPYASARSFRALDARDANRPRFDKGNEYAGGIDAKIVLKDNLTLDVTANPDFGQIESDEPQVTVNQRFEVFFPERRPFFLENSDYFQTPINLVFTRRIADPQFGVKLTGKVGKYSIGTMFIDDQAPGRRVPDNDLLSGERAHFAIMRVRRDIFKNSNIGAIFTDREFAGSSNRAGGIDGRLKFGSNWIAKFQAVKSETKNLNNTRESGSAYDFIVSREGRKFNYEAEASSFSPGFQAQSGFIRRRDIRSFSQSTSYQFRPENKILTAWGPRVRQSYAADHDGTRLDWTAMNSLFFEFTGRTRGSVTVGNNRERLRAKDWGGNRDLDFSSPFKGISLNSSYFRRVSLLAEYFRFPGINFNPAVGQAPFLTDRDSVNLTLTTRPLSKLRIDNTYISSRAISRQTGASIFNNHIIRSKFNWQFNRELSLRTIFQYNTVLANPLFSSLKNTKNFNADILMTWQPNAGTAFYVGYNSNLQNLNLVPTPTGSQVVRYPNQFINDGKQLFVKFSYLFRM